MVGRNAKWLLKRRWNHDACFGTCTYQTFAAHPQKPTQLLPNQHEGRIHSAVVCVTTKIAGLLCVRVLPSQSVSKAMIKYTPPYFVTFV